MEYKKRGYPLSGSPLNHDYWENMIVCIVASHLDMNIS